MMTIVEIQAEIEEEFAFFEDWMERYEHLIELGKSLPLIDEKYKNKDHIIKGCQSQVWLHADVDESGNMQLTADSDAILTKGIIALMIRVYSGQKPAAILASDNGFIDRIGLKEHLSPTRANGLLAMVKQIKFYALAFQSKQDQKTAKS